MCERTKTQKKRKIPSLGIEWKELSKRSTFKGYSDIERKKKCLKM